jgi:glycerophosphoryl diester phosphodiesterase
MVNQLLIGLCLTYLARNKAVTRNRLSKEPQYNNQYAIVTFEVIALKTKSKELGRTIGIYPKQNILLFMKQNLHITDKLLEELTAVWNNEEAPVYVQSFEVTNLQYIRSKSTVKPFSY